MVPPLESILCTGELDRRPSRPPDYQRESLALVSLAQALSDSPGNILQTLAETILDVCEAGSAGISLLTDDAKRFYWPAIAGQWQSQIGGGTPRDFSPCGDVLDRNSPLLFGHIDRRYTYFQPVKPPVEEALLVPFYVEGIAVGTIWAIAHDERRKFDNEDLRILVSLGLFASATYEAVEQVRALREQAHERQTTDRNLREMNEALLVSSIKQHELAEQAQQAEKKVHASEARYRRLFETTKDGVLILDFSSGQIVDVNPFMIELMGYSHGDFLNKELWQIGLFSDQPANTAAVTALHEQGYLRYQNIPLKTKDGRQIEVEFVSSVYQVDHTPVIQCNIRDNTERSRLERQTHDQAEALAKLHRRKDEFLAMLSHELRNPLSAIFNALHVLRLDDTGKPIQEKAKSIIERQVGQLAHLVDDLLEVSRVITGGIQLHQQQLEMRGIVDRAVESARPLIDRRKHELSVTLPAEPLWLTGDPTRLEQVVVNLLNNAAKYTDEGGQIRLTVDQEGGDVVLCVRDTGVGIAPELLPRIFDLFTQAERTLDRSQGGLGIGLSLVQKLVELHGGNVEARSGGLGQGSVFIVRLPALYPTTDLVASVEIAQKAAQSSRVLVVDDNVDAADMLVMMLQMFGNKVQAVYSGQTAMETAVEYKPDCILLDIGLPDMNGYEVARRLRQLPQTKDMWLIAMTGYGQDSDRQQAQAAGFDHHLVKPVEPQKLQDLLETLAHQPRPAK